MPARKPRFARRKPTDQAVLPVPAVTGDRPDPAPPQDEPDDEDIRRMLEAAYT